MRTMRKCYRKMLLSFLISVGAIVFVSSYAVPLGIRDFLHERIPFGVVPSEAAHVLCGATAIVAYWLDPEHFKTIFRDVYLKGMVVKASLIVFTLMPDANPECFEWSPTKCLTRNDMLPSGHMLVALSSGLVLGPKSFPILIACAFLLVASHMHYCVDVILSFWIVYYLERDRIAVKNAGALCADSDRPHPLRRSTRSTKNHGPVAV